MALEVADLDNAKRDANDLSSLVNGNQTVTTRTGGDKLSVDQALRQIIVGEVAVYSAASTYTDIEDWVEYSGVVYRPLPSALPIGPEAFNAANWSVAQGFATADNVDLTVNGLSRTSVQSYLENKEVPDYAALIALSSIVGTQIADGDVCSVTNVNIAGNGVFRNVVGHGYTSTYGVIVSINSDWYWERSINNSTVYSDWFEFAGSIDEYEKIDAMLEYDTLHFKEGIEYHYGSYATPRSLDLTRAWQQIFLNGATLAVPNERINAKADDITIDLGKGFLSQHVRYAEVATTTTVGTSTITVVDPQYLEVGQEIASSWGDTAGSGEYPIGGPTGSPKRTITDITGNVVTVDTALSGSTETVPAGVTFGEFLFISFLYGFENNFTVKNGTVHRCRGYYYRTYDSGGTAGGSTYFKDIDFASNGLDQVHLKNDQKVYFDNCTMQKQWDVAKTGFWLDGNASVYIDNCRPMKLGNFDSAFNFRGTASTITGGEIAITDSVIDGTNEIIPAPASSFAVDTLFIFEIAAGITYDRIRCSNTRFVGYARHFITNGSTVKSHQTVLNSIQLADCSVDCSFGYFQYSGSGNGIICPNVQISNTSFYQDQIYTFWQLSDISSASSSFVPEFSDCYFKLQASGYARFTQPAKVRNSRFNDTELQVRLNAVQFDNCYLENGSTLSVVTLSGVGGAQFAGTFIVDDPNFPEIPDNIFTAFGGTTANALRLAKAKSINGSFWYDVFKAGPTIFCSTVDALKSNGAYFFTRDDYFIPLGSQVRDMYTGLLERVTFNLQTTLAAAASASDTSLTVTSATSVAIGDKINLLLDDGTVDTLEVDAAYGGGATIPLTGSVTSAAANGNNINFFRLVSI